MPTTSLAEIIRTRIAANGPVTFRDFMEAALYDPQYGYYTSGRARIGRGGDFFTNVSIGPLFGRLLARQFAQMWERLGSPAKFTIVEQGAHDGLFALDALGALREVAPECFAAVQWRIIEPLTALRARQVERLREFNVDWCASVEALSGFEGVHFSNELIDAMTVNVMVWTGTEWMERRVDWRDDRFVFVDDPISSNALRAHLATLPEVPPGFVAEVNLPMLDWIDTLAVKLSRGWVLAVDYGYTHRNIFAHPSGTLTGYAAHRREPDVLSRPGEIDLTAHVDFTSLAVRAQQAGLTLAGFTDQHHFMVGLGRLHFRDDAVPEQSELRAYKTLMHPTFMGRAFHAIGLSKNVPSATLAGFEFARKSDAP